VSQVVLKPAGTQVSIVDSDCRGGLSIALTQPKGSNARWKFSVRAQSDESLISIGEFTSSPPANNRLSRFVAIANCPGATGWALFVNLASGEADDAIVSLAAGLMTSVPGLSRISERYKQYEDSAAGVVNILPGETVMDWTVSAGAAAGSLTIDSNGPIIIPVNSTVSGNPGGLLQGPVTMTFAGANTSYFVEVAESA